MEKNERAGLKNRRHAVYILLYRECTIRCLACYVVPHSLPSPASMPKRFRHFVSIVCAIEALPDLATTAEATRYSTGRIVYLD